MRVSLFQRLRTSKTRDNKKRRKRKKSLVSSPLGYSQSSLIPLKRESC